MQRTDFTNSTKMTSENSSTPYDWLKITNCVREKPENTRILPLILKSQLKMGSKNAKMEVTAYLICGWPPLNTYIVPLTHHFFF